MTDERIAPSAIGAGSLADRGAVAEEAGEARTHGLLVAGALAGPLFLTVALVQVAVRDGFDITRLAISSLSLGDLGWIQIANFVVTGALTVAFGLGVGRSRIAGRPTAWGSRLLVLFGVGLVASGLFTTDPALGFPPGTPDGMPLTWSWHAVVHSIAFAGSFVSLVAAAVVFARRFAAGDRPGWTFASLAVAVACVVLSVWPGQDGAGIRYLAASALAFAWMTALAIELRRPALTDRTSTGS